MDVSLQPTLCKAKVYIAPSKSEVANTLSNLIIQSCHAALVQSHRGIFTIALSGGSLPSLLSCLPEAFAIAKINPQWNKWHVILADERCVVSSLYCHKSLKNSTLCIAIRSDLRSGFYLALCFYLHSRNLWIWHEFTNRANLLDKKQ